MIEWIPGQPETPGCYFVTRSDKTVGVIECIVDAGCVYRFGEGASDIIAYAPLPPAYEPPGPKPLFWLAVDENGTERQFDALPVRTTFPADNCWDIKTLNDESWDLAPGTIKQILGRELTWDDEPVPVYKEDAK